MPYINANYGASGTIWEGRYKSSIVHDEEYLLTCMRYIELNPVRAAMVNQPAEYRWSSYRCNAHGTPDSRVTNHILYSRLGDDDQSRQAAYRNLFNAHVDEPELLDIRSALQTGTPLGNGYFKTRIEAKLNMKVGQAKRGRPAKSE